MHNKMDWWRTARFGMFVHWGPYARYGGQWKGREIDFGLGRGYGEWIMFNAKIPHAEYAAEAARFRPHAFDADALARLARDAGMGYLVVTAKHHDGFAMFHSRASRYNIVDHAGFDRDPVRELAEACRRQGLRFGVYYSQAQDWHHPGGAVYSGTFESDGDPVQGHWDPAQRGSFDDYLERIALPQVEELLTGYGPIDILWWDTPIGMSRERAARFAPLLARHPGLIVNNRLSDYTPGDTETPEQHIPVNGSQDRDWEVCMTLNDTWGFNRRDGNWKPADTLIRHLSDIASKGGNFLLNVGPDGEGRVPEACAARLRSVGRWLGVNGRAVYGTTAGGLPALPWGRCTAKRASGGTALYLHVFDWPAGGELLVPGLPAPVSRATLLATDEPVAAAIRDGGVALRLPARAPDAAASVVELWMERTG